jgi:hypothetical protein
MPGWDGMHFKIEVEAEAYVPEATTLAKKADTEFKTPAHRNDLVGSLASGVCTVKAGNVYFSNLHSPVRQDYQYVHLIFERPMNREMVDLSKK